MSTPRPTSFSGGAPPSRLRWLSTLAWLLVLGGAAYGAVVVLTPEPPPPPELLTINLGDAIFRTEATGRIVPREEVFVHSLVSGQLVELRVRAGDTVKKGQHIATVRIVADPVMLGEARAQVRLSQARLETASRELTRLASLKAGISLSSRELVKAQDDERLARTELEGLQERTRMIEKGVSGAGSGRSTHIVATIDGVVLATPVAVGDFVSEMNAYRDGATVAVLADMTHLLFKGQIEEAHVGKLRIGMPANVRVGALPNVVTKGELSWVAPRATIESSSGASSSSAPSTGGAAPVVPLTASTAGITRFEMWVELNNPPPGMRAGYTASAELALEQRLQVPVVEERALRFDRGKVFARVRTSLGSLEEREIQVGVSDGIKIEITSGLHAGDQIAAYDAP